jgi:hypothetical protein
MKKTIALLALAGLLVMGGTALANIGAVDNVPAATLLMPRFEVSLADPEGINTLFSVNNASDEIVVAHVTLWSEWWIPVLDFDVYLTGYDVQTMSLRDIIINGDLPNTGPSNTLSPLGAFSVGPHGYPNCTTTPGGTPNYGIISGSFLQQIQRALSGQPTPLCYSEPVNTDLARGYITVDVVRACSQEFPDNANYFVDGGLGTATNDNVLWGDYFFVNQSENFAQGWTLVHIEASSDLLATLGSCDNDEIGTDRYPTTFYCSIFAGGLPGEDNREGLPSVYATRYVEGGGFTGGTSVIAWRDVNIDGAPAPGPRACNNPPPRAGQNDLVVFDEQENPIQFIEGPSGFEPPEDQPFPWCTNRADVGTDITIGSPFGWIYMNLNTDDTSPDIFRQAYVTTVMDAQGRFSVGFDAISLNNLTGNANGFQGDARCFPDGPVLCNPDPTLGPPPNPDAPTLFSGNTIFP